MIYTPIPITLEQTFTPTTDNTQLAATGYTSMDKIRFVDGAPETVAGWASVTFNNDATISGACRLLYSQQIGTTGWLLIGTNLRLYANASSQLTNITPLLATSNTLPNNPITTYYPTLANNPFTTVNGSQDVTVAYTAHRFQVFDIITISGAATTNGIPNTDFNATHVVRSVAANSFVITVDTAATSAGTGGGASVVVASGLITVTDTAHGLPTGDRVKLSGATATGGITAPQINMEHIIRNIGVNSYDIMTGGSSTSAASGGGAAVERFKQIAAGSADASTGVGYSAGNYSQDQFSSAIVSSSLVLPRIWSAAPYGDNVIMTAGSQTGVYIWDGDTSEAPIALTNAPTAVNYVFTDREIVITLGQGGVGNRVKTSDRGQSTVWTGTSQNEVYENNVVGAGTFISHASIRGVNYLFTEKQTYAMTYLGKPAIWQIVPRLNVGIVAQNARIVIEDVCYFVSNNNIYSFDGGVVRPLLGIDKWRKYVFNNLSATQKSKTFLSYREKFNELIIWYPTANEIDSYISYNIRTGQAASGTLERTAEESPYPLTDNPRLIDSDGVMYLHEFGVNDNGAAMDWHLETKWLENTINVESIHGLNPDSIQTGNISLTAYVADYPQSSEVRETEVLTITPTTEEAFFAEVVIRGGVHKYRIEGNELNGSWRAGVWRELVKQSTPRV